MAKLRDLRDTLVVLAGLVIVGLAIHAIASVYGPESPDAVEIAIIGSWGVFLLGFFGRWIYGLKSAGRVLLDCGPHPGRWGLLAIAITVALIASLPVVLRKRFNTSYWLFLSIAGNNLLLASSRLQIREHGIFHYWGLLRWHTIASYCWCEDAKLVLSMRRPLFRRVAISVPPDKKQLVDDLLARLCPVKYQVSTNRAFWVAATGIVLLVGGGVLRWEYLSLTKWQSSWLLTHGVHTDSGHVAGAYQDFSLVVMGLGAALIVVATQHWLRVNEEPQGRNVANTGPPRRSPSQDQSAAEG